MKYFLLLFTCSFVNQLGFSQVDLSAGVFYRNDLTLRKNVDKEPVYKDDPDSYFGYAFSVDKRFDNHLFGVEFQFHQKELDLKSTQYFNIYGGHYDTGSSSRKQLACQVNYGYLGTRFHLGKILFDEKKNNLLIGGFLHIDALVFEKESNHWDSTTITSHGIGYDYKNDVLISYTTVTNYEPVRDEFDLVLMKKTYFSMGTNVGHRFNYGKYYSDFRARLGINMGLPRLEYRPYSADYEFWDSTEKNTKAFYQFDLKIGYSF
ncbi:MAG: hypothetical protein GQ574_09840 [Crocinitomix sp.]|nr:hypothetical protein [Crocinitomix sp.]